MTKKVYRTTTAACCTGYIDYDMELSPLLSDGAEWRDDPWLTIDEASALANTTRRSFIALLRSKQLPYFRAGGVYILQSELNQWLGDQSEK